MDCRSRCASLASCAAMASAIYILNDKGGQLVGRDFRGDLPPRVIEKFIERVRDEEEQHSLKVRSDPFATRRSVGQARQGRFFSRWRPGERVPHVQRHATTVSWRLRMHAAGARALAPAFCARLRACLRPLLFVTYGRPLLCCILRRHFIYPSLYGAPQPLMGLPRTARVLRSRCPSWRTHTHTLAQPVFEIDGVSYIYLMHHSLYVVAMTNLNADAALVLMFLHELLKVFTGYFGTVFVVATQPLCDFACRRVLRIANRVVNHRCFTSCCIAADRSFNFVATFLKKTFCPRWLTRVSPQANWRRSRFATTLSSFTSCSTRCSTLATRRSPTPNCCRSSSRPSTIKVAFDRSKKKLAKKTLQKYAKIRKKIRKIGGSFVC